MENILEIICNSWEDYKLNIYKYFLNERDYKCSNYIFRGQKDTNWNLISSFDRWFSFYNFRERELILKRVLSSFYESIKAYNLLPHDCTKDDLYFISLAQHYGVPTRLLDWTESPYVAAFFAFVDVIRSNIYESDVAIWALNTKSKSWSSELGIDIVRLSHEGNLRIRNQIGLFTISRTPFSTVEEYVLYTNMRDTALIKFIIPQSEAITAIRDLDLMNINSAVLYQGLEGCADLVKVKTILDLKD